MPTIKHLQMHVRLYGVRHSHIYLVGMLIFFWSLYDGILAYLIPLIITEHGFSKTYMGFIVGSSSIFGALFDIVAIRILPSMHYRRVFMFMFSVCLLYPFVLYGAKSIPLYILAMALWGIYYDLKNFGLFDFVSQNTSKEEHASSFGVVQVLQSSGYLLAPIIAGFVVVETITWTPFWYSLLFLGCAFVCFFLLVSRDKKSTSHSIPLRRKNILDIHMWLSLDRIIFPVLLMTFTLYLIDAYFWTIGPLFAETFTLPGQHGELILAAYTFPGLLVGWLVRPVTERPGKKITAFMSLMIGSILLLFLMFVSSYYLALIIVFTSSIFLSLALPAVNGVYADLMQEQHQYEEEIATLTDFYTNLGYIFGPMAAGFTADLFGNATSISTVGIFGVVVAFVLMNITPQHINIHKKDLTPPLDE